MPRYSMISGCGCCGPSGSYVSCLSYSKHLLLDDGQVDPVLGVGSTGQNGFPMFWVAAENRWASAPASGGYAPDGRVSVDGTTGLMTATCPGGGVSTYTPTDVYSLDPTAPDIFYSGVTDLAGLCGTTSYPYDLFLFRPPQSPCLPQHYCADQMPERFCAEFQFPATGYPAGSYWNLEPTFTMVSGQNLWQSSFSWLGHDYLASVRPDTADYNCAAAVEGGASGEEWEANVRVDGAENGDWYAAHLGGSPLNCLLAGWNIPITPSGDGCYLQNPDPPPSGSMTLNLVPGSADGCCDDAFSAVGPKLFGSFSGGNGGLECLDGFEFEVDLQPLSLEIGLNEWATVGATCLEVPDCGGLWMTALMRQEGAACPPDSPSFNFLLNLFGSQSGCLNYPDNTFPNQGMGGFAFGQASFTYSPATVAFDLTVSANGPPPVAPLSCCPADNCQTTVTFTR